MDVQLTLRQITKPVFGTHDLRVYICAYFLNEQLQAVFCKAREETTRKGSGWREGHKCRATEEMLPGTRTAERTCWAWLCGN